MCHRGVMILLVVFIHLFSQDTENLTSQKAAPQEGAHGWHSHNKNNWWNSLFWESEGEAYHKEIPTSWHEKKHLEARQAN